MPTFVASKFNGMTDPGRPVIGSTIIVNGKTFTIVKVDFKEAKDVMKMALEGGSPDKEGCDDVLFDQHQDRPFVYWVVWVNEIVK